MSTFDLHIFSRHAVLLIYQAIDQFARLCFTCPGVRFWSHGDIGRRDQGQHSTIISDHWKLSTSNLPTDNHRKSKDCSLRHLEDARWTGAVFSQRAATLKIV